MRWLMDKVVITKNKLDTLAQHINAKAGTSGAKTIAQMQSTVDAIPQVNARIYTLTLEKKSGWILLTTLDEDVISHMNDDSISAMLYNISPYQSVSYAGRCYFAGNTPIGKNGEYPVYGYTNRIQNATSTAVQPMYYKPFDTTTNEALGGVGRFRYSSDGKFYVKPSDGFICPGTYLLIFTW